MKRKCAKCKLVKSSNSFYSDNRKRDGKRSRCIRCIAKDSKKRYEKNPQSFLISSRKSYRKNYIIYKERAAEKYRKSLTRLFNVLGSECKKCGISDKRILQLDHINGGGAIDRRANSTGYTYYWRIAEKIEKGNKDFQILCANCNLISAIEKGYKKSIWQ